MTRILVALFLATIGVTPVWALEETALVTLQSGATTNAAGSTVVVSGYTTLGLDITITNTATVTIQGRSAKGGTFRDVKCTNSADGVSSATFTSSANIKCVVAGLSEIKAPISSCSSCTVSVGGRLTTASAGSGSGGGGGLVVTENDSSPSITASTIRFTNGTVTDSGSGIASVTISGTGAPTDAPYWTGAAVAGLSAEVSLAALTTGLVINTAGTPSAYAGATCTNQVIRVLSASGAATCSTITSAFVDASILTSGGALGTPSSGVGTNITVTSTGGSQARTLPVRAEEFKNALDYGATVTAGVTAIQAAEGSANSIGAANPLKIYIPPGSYTLTSAITITRHNVTLLVDGGAKIVPANNTAAIVFDGTATAEGYLKNWGLILDGVIWGNATGTGQHGIVLKNAIHGKMRANEIRALGGDGIRIDGSVFSNDIKFNRIHGIVGWGVNTVNDVAASPAFNSANILEGEVQSSQAGAARFRRWFSSDIYLRVENMSTNVVAVELDSSRDVRFRGYFENPSNLSGDDIRVLATDFASENLVFDSPLIFYDEKTSGNYNIRLSDSTTTTATVRAAKSAVTARFLYIGSGNTGVTIYPEAGFNHATITNNASGQLRYAGAFLSENLVGVTEGGSGLTAVSADQVYVGTASNTFTAKTLPDCDNATTSKLLYDQTTHAFSCGTDQSGGGGGAVATDAIWDAAGDLAVGSGANTAVRLAKGNDGDVLTISGGNVQWGAGGSGMTHPQVMARASVGF